MKFIKKHWLEILLHLLAWAAVLYVLTDLGAANTFVLRIKDLHNGSIMQRDTVRSVSPYSFLIIVFLMILFYGNVFWLFNRMANWDSGYKQLLTAALWFVFLYFADYFIVGFWINLRNPGPSTLMEGTIPDPNGHGSLRFRELGIDDIVSSSWRKMQFNVLLIFLFTMGSSITYFFSKNWIANELIRKQLQANQLSTEIKFLKSQINPHFLFNTLNNLFSMAQGKGNDELADGISKLSEMMRYMLYESNEEQVSLKDEIEYLQNSITLNKLRYADDEAKVELKYPENIEDLFVAPMLFIPFVENAFKHGVLIGKSSAINISILTTDKHLTFICENNNYGFVKKMDNTGGIGLENVKRRLELVYPDRHELLIKNEENKYAVTLKINLA